MFTSVYRPPSTCPEEFILELNTYLNNCTNENDLHIFIGDINIDLLSKEKMVEEYLNILYEKGFKSAINNRTRIQNNTESCIDHLFIKSNNTINNYKCMPIILETDITDHFSIVLRLVFPESKKVKGKVTKEKKYLNKEKLIQQLENENWDDICNVTNVNTASEMFINKLKNYISINTNVIKINFREIKKTAWITNGLIKSISIKKTRYTK